MTNNVTIDWSADINVDDEEVYESLVRAIGRTEGFGLFFVRCVEKDRAKLEQRLRGDLPRLRLERLELKEDLKDGNLYRRLAEVEQQRGPLNGLFISGLEKSLDPYVKSGYGGLGDYYNKDTVPRVLGHLNLQRERFRDDFPFCLIFFLSAFGIKYIARRAPDFFDWRSGLFEFIADEAKLGRLTQELWGDYDEYLNWSETQRLDRIREIQALIDEDRQTSTGKATLFFEKANILAAGQNYEEAIASYEKAVEFKRDYQEAWYNRGIALGALNRHEEAIASYDKAIKFNSDYHEAWFNRGAMLLHLNRYEEAIASYDKAIKFKPDGHQAWFNRGALLGNLKRYEEAITAFDKVIELKPNDHQAWFSRGIALGALNRHEEAIIPLDKAVEFKHDYQEAWYNRGVALSNLTRYEEAIISFDKAIEFNPDDQQAWANRAAILGNNLTRYEEAIISFDKAIALKPGDYKVWFNRACTNTLQSSTSLAFADLAEAFRLNPEESQKLAATDPDLEPLREDPRFEKLLGLATTA
jgi:tetratricopeptide (TPR) repeat protein